MSRRKTKKNKKKSKDFRKRSAAESILTLNSRIFNSIKKEKTKQNKRKQRRRLQPRSHAITRSSFASRGKRADCVIKGNFNYKYCLKVNRETSSHFKSTSDIVVNFLVIRQPSSCAFYMTTALPTIQMFSTPLAK